MDESLSGLIVLGIIVMVMVMVMVIASKSAAREKERREQLDHQKRIFEAWTAERFGPSEVHEAARLRPPDPEEPGLNAEEWKRRREIVRRLSQRWAENIIREDKGSRKRQTEHFESWGEERFGDSWPETRDRLCRLVSANRTPSIDRISDSEIETLNSYLLAETLGAVNPGDTAAVKQEETTKSIRWAQQKCQNCGAPLLKGQCIYCDTAYAPT